MQQSPGDIYQDFRRNLGTLADKRASDISCPVQKSYSKATNAGTSC